MEGIASVLRREIPWRQHWHRADDIATALRIADEFGYQLVIDHGTEAHLVADLLAAKGIPVLIGPLLTSRSKVELRNRSLANPGRLAAAGVEISIITDHPVVPINFLVYQAALAVKEGLNPEIALRAITIHPGELPAGAAPERRTCARGRQERRFRPVVRRPARRDAARSGRLHRRSPGVLLRHRHPRRDRGAAVMRGMARRSRAVVPCSRAVAPWTPARDPGSREVAP